MALAGFLTDGETRFKDENISFFEGCRKNFDTTLIGGASLVIRLVSHNSLLESEILDV